MIIPRFCFFSTFFFLLASNVIAGVIPQKRAPLARTTPPAGAVVVRRENAQASEFTTVQAAVNSLPNDNSPRTIFIYPGTYSERVTISRNGPLTIYGYTEDVSSFLANQVTITHAGFASSKTDDVGTATMAVDMSDFALYNVDLRNSFGKTASRGQALAISASGTKQGYYGVSFFSYQDTVLSESGTHIYAKCNIIGAVDYIWGQYAYAYFHKCTIESVGPGSITADGPVMARGSLFVINESDITISKDASNNTSGFVYLGRPWSDYACVVYTNCNLGSHINNSGWSEWSSDKPNTASIFFAEYKNYGPGAGGQRASFAKQLSSDTGYTITDVLGKDYSTWVDQTYL